MPGLINLPGIAGCDEAGRGPLAGPVVCAAIVLPIGFDIRGLDDSKKLNVLQRTEAEKKIKETADWAICIVESVEIDRINILNASLVGMSRSLEMLKETPKLAFIDGNKIPEEAPCPCEPKVHGDAAYACIAAASILAKNARDRIMINLHERFPEYGFAKHFGYPTKEHLEALREYGPCLIHRRSFAPVAEALNQPSLSF